MPINIEFDKAEKVLLVVILILCIPAFFLNLGLLAFNEDEAIRALVAYEMLYNSDYIVPTLNGLPYYYKPPVYNWFIAFTYTITGTVNEFTSRLPTLFFLSLFSFIIYKTNRIYLSQKMSLLIALCYITCGRVLFWDSFMALIDIGYSVISYLTIFLSYHYYNKEKYIRFFVITALLTAIGYLMKGFSSFIFYGASIGSILLFKKDLKRLYKGPGLLIGLSLMASIIGLYYYAYNQSHDFSNTIGPLLDQSTRRTIGRFGPLRFFKHLITYPFENVYHFFPWVLPGLLLFNTDIRKKVFANDYIKYCFILFVANILIYWVSPEVYPRYILMLIPISLTVIFFMINEAVNHSQKWWLFFRWYFLLIPFIPLLGIIVGFNHPGIHLVPYPYLKLTGLGLSFIVLIILMFKTRRYLFWYVIISLLLTRIGFNMFVMPERYDGSIVTKSKMAILSIQEKYDDRPIRLYKKSIMDKTCSFYLATANGYPNIIEEEITDKFYYIVDTLRVDYPAGVVKLDSFILREFDRECYLVEKDQD